MLVVAACLGATAVVWGATIQVPANYTSIQNAINAASDGDEVVIAPGTYVERLNFDGKAITVRSQDPNDPTIVAATIIKGYNGELDVAARNFFCEPVVTFASGEGENSRLLGLTITNGIAEIGAGILCDGASPTIQQNVITNNGIAYFNSVGIASKQPESAGGGIACLHGASPLIDGNEISLNFAVLGGGIYATGSTTRPRITNNTITANTAYVGGGIYADLGVLLTVENNSFGTAPAGAMAAQAASMKGKADAARQKKTATGDAKAKAARVAGSDYVRKAFKASAASVAKLKSARKFSYSGNVAVIGGAIAIANAKMNLYNNTFTSNSAIDFGGAIAGYELCLDSSGNVFDRNFTDDIDEYITQIEEDNGFGGALSLVYGQADFCNDKFTYNTSGGGGAIAVDSGTIVVKDCLFDHNMANEEGGAIVASGFENDRFTVAVECSSFTHNSSYSGGAIAAWSPCVEPFSPFNIVDSTFDCNTAVCDSGGAVYVEDGVEMAITKSSFTNNAADYYGAAIANINALLKLTDSTLSGNLGADYCYGTVYVEEEEEDRLVPPPITPEAAKHFDADDNLIQGNTFVRNINYEGAGVYVESGKILITTNIFRENTVNGEGGAIYWANEDDYGAISYNEFIGNSASRGGAIFIEPESHYVKIEFNTFNGNIAGTAAGKGGALFIGSSAGVENNTFCKNSAGYQGGAIFVGDLVQIVVEQIAQSYVGIKNNSFADNFALQGGAIFTQILENSVPAAAKSDGGVIIKNNIIAFSKRGCGVWFEGQAPVFAYNDVFGNVPNNYCNVPDLTGIDGNISADPLFVDRANCNLFVMSVAGRFDVATGTFVRDTVTSRTIDAGDPCSEVCDEPNQNGGIINQGAQGGTELASKSSIFACVVFAQGQDGVSRSGPYKFVFFNNVNRDSVTARMNVYQDNSVCATAKQITSGIKWDGKNKLCFNPFPPLEAATGYRLVFGSGIRQCNGTAVQWAESFPFVTGVEPVVTAICPERGDSSVATDSVISVNFDQSMRTNSVELCWQIRPRTAGTFAWNEEGSAFDFVPDSPLVSGIDYTVTIGACSRDLDGDPMLRSFCWTFHTGSFSGSSAAAAVTATAASTSSGAQITVNLASAATVSASIRNIAGVEIATVAPRALDSGVSTLLWNGKSKNGTNVPAGRYLVTVSAAKADGTQANAMTTLQR